jgi:putative nucleotidyltransferase with HDIG domain
MAGAATRIELTHPLLAAIGAVADRRETEIYVVGGYVRDLLLGKAVNDIDVLVMGDGVAFAREVARELGLHPVVPFERFGTAMVPVDQGKLEFVTARKEQYDPASRKPAVERGTLEDDLLRRDFTVNALAVSLNLKSYGRLSDPLGGIADMDRGVLRTPLEPEQTYSDDPLRMMRAARFAAQLGFSVDLRSLEAITAMGERIAIVSQERVTEELMKLLAAPVPSIGFKILHETRLLALVFPELAAMSGVDQRKDHHHKDVFLHSLKVLDNLAAASDNLWLRFAALVHDIAKPRTKAFVEGTGWTFHGHEEVGARMMKKLFQRMRLPMDKLHYVEKLVRLHLRPMALVDVEVTDSAVRRLVFEAGESIDDLMTLCRADITSKNPALVSRVLKNYDLVARKVVEVEEKDRLRNWRPPVRGEEIMAVCGIGPGRMVGELKTAIEEAILDGRIPNDHDAALQHLLQIKDAHLNPK